MLDFIKQLKAKKHGKIIEYYKSTGGDMSGSHDVVTVKKYSDEQAVIKHSSSPAHNIKPTVTEALVPITIFETIGKIYDEKKFYKLPFRKKSKMVVLDDATTSYYWTFETGNTARCSSGQELTAEECKNLREMNQMIIQAMQEGTKI